MLYDWADRPLDLKEGKTPDYVAKRLVAWEPLDREMDDASRGLTPTKLDGYFRDANSGDPRSQARLAMEILEKDWDTAQAVGVRVAAPCGITYNFAPPDGLENDATAKKIAEEAKRALRGGKAGATDTDVVGLSGLFRSMMGALLPGYSLAETIWAPGAREVIGYAPIDIAKITFTNSREPLIASRSNPNGLALAPYKFVFHQHSAISGDPTRGGLIRPLGWMFLFTQLGVKNLARFVEKFGLPFVIGRLDDGAWDQDRHKVAALIRNFGSDGGGVFSKAVELEFKEAAASGGDLFFKMLEYFGDAKTRVVLGQLATSGDSGGFSKGGAQALVRQDLLESDCAALAATFKRDVIAPWTMLNYGAGAPVPDLVFDVAAPEDLVAKSQIIGNLYNAGLEVDDPDQASKLVGIRMRRKVSTPALPDPAMLSGERRPSKPYKVFMAEAARSANEKVAQAALRNLSQDEAFLSEFIGPVADAIGEALAGLPDTDPTPEQADEFSRRLSALIDARPRIARKMNSRALEDQLFQAMIAADANGRLAVLAGLSQGARGA